MDFIAVMMGSKNDGEVMKHCIEVLKKFDVPFEVMISSAYQNPERTREYIQDAQERGAQVFIAVLDFALAASVASRTHVPVIGVPLGGGILEGIESVVLKNQTPAFMPIATMSAGRTGAVQSAYLAMQILALKDKELSGKLAQDRVIKAKKVELDAQEFEASYR